MPHTMSDPVVSTVIPTYNRPRETVEAVKSAIAQTYPADRHEIIVVDDGSNDGGATEAALAPFRERLRYLRKENGGVSSARNFGLAHARGELLALLDSDDLWRPEKLRQQVDFVRAHPRCGLLVTDFIRVDGEGRAAGVYHMRPRLLDEGPNLAQALRFPGLPPSSILVRRSVIDDVGAFDTNLRTAEDVDFHLRVARAHGVGLVEEPLILYKLGHADGLSFGRNSYADHMRVIRGFADRHAAELTGEVRRQVLLKHYLQNARGLIAGGWYGDGLLFAGAGARHARSLDDALMVGELGYHLLRHAAGRVGRRLRT